MPGLLDLRNHLVFYRKYHMNHTNVAIHLFCIPLILLSALSMSIGVVILDTYPKATVGTVIAWVYGLYYLLLDWQLGLPAFLFLAAYAHIQRNFYGSLALPSSALSQSQYVRIALAIHIACWLAQFYGHAFHEKRAPALVHNLLQALVLAPFFVVFEVAFWMGYKLDIKIDMDNRAGKERLKMIQQEKHKQ